MERVLRYFQKGFNYSQDGPGNRLVYHLQGCQLHCPWCANPEGMAAAGACRAEPTDAVVRAILSARPMYFDGGGVTLTGGEVSLQTDAACEVLGEARAAGVHTCVETNADTDRFGELLAVVDHLIADFKHPDAARHEAFTGAPNARIKRNLQYAAQTGADMLIHIPLIHGVNDDDEALRGFIEFLAPLGAPAELLPYHEFGKDKWLALRGHYAMTDAFVPPARVAAFEQAFRDAGIPVVHT